MTLEATNSVGRQYIAASYAQQALDGWSAAFAAGDVPDAMCGPLEALGEFYGEVRRHGETLVAFWSRLRPILEAHALDPPRTEPSEVERLAIAEAKAATHAMPVPPQLDKLAFGNGTDRLVNVHSDHEGWVYQLCAALGTRSLSVVHAFVGELQRLSTPAGEVDEDRLNAALAIINDAKPKNGVQAAMCVQMIALHWACMKIAERAVRYGTVPDSIALAKLSRAFDLKAESLAKLQGKVKRQKVNIRVEKHDHRHHHQHVHVSEGGAAGNGSQPHVSRTERSKAGTNAAPPLEHAPGATVRSEDASGNVVSLPGQQREEPVLSPRRRAWFGRSEG